LKNLRKWGPVMIPDITLRQRELRSFSSSENNTTHYPWSYPNLGGKSIYNRKWKRSKAYEKNSKTGKGRYRV
jgi:hypothetical protein